jgi:hypothetical protein
MAIEGTRTDVATRPVLLLGSVPLASAREVFEIAGERLAGLLDAMPDGETGERLAWVLWLLDRWRDKEGLEVVNELMYDDPVTGRKRGVPFFALGAGVSADEVAWGPLGYADVALESYATFKEAKDDGTLAADVRFQVSLPTPMGIALLFPQHRDEVLPSIERAMADEVARVLDAVPHDELSLQWDAPGEVMELERGGLDAWPVEAATSSIARISAPIPDEVRLGVHLCYGDPDGHHVIEPKDASVMTAFANSLVELVDRRLDYVHMPVPIERDDDAYFAPLGELRLPPQTTVYLGLVHLEDGLEGARRRIDAASEHVERFGVAGECGLGRGERAQDIPALLDLHRVIARL